MITAQELRDLLHYDPQTGSFTWKPGATKHRTGREAGYTTDEGYRKILIRKQMYFAHRLAWLYVYGQWPDQEIDHINHARDDNKISNLRDVSHAENVRCQRTNLNKRGVARYDKETRKYRARFRRNGREINLGAYATREEAHEVTAAYFERGEIPPGRKIP